MNQETVKTLLDAFDRSDWQEMVVTIGGDRLHVSREPLPAGAALPAPAAAPPPPAAAPAAPSPAAAPAAPAAPPTPAPAPAPAAPAAESIAGTPVTSPSVGLFWHAPAPDAPPFAAVGDRVAAGDTIGIVEVMKLMNHVASPVAGVVVAVLVGNGETVEFGETLVVIDPEG